MTTKRVVPMTTCAACSGTGKAVDHSAVGRLLRAERERRNVTLRALAREVKISAAYLSDLERGKRSFGGGGSLRALRAVGLGWLAEAV